MRWPFRFYDRLGIEFPYQGDTLIWIWPWKRKPRKCEFYRCDNGYTFGPCEGFRCPLCRGRGWLPAKKYISVLASGTGEFGDAYFNSLKAVRKFWRRWEKAGHDPRPEILRDPLGYKSSLRPGQYTRSGKLDPKR